MHIVQTKAVFLGLDVQVLKTVWNELEKGFEDKDFLVLTDEESRQKFLDRIQAQSSLYVLQILIHKGQVIGLLAIDKLVGDIVLVQTNTIIWSDSALEFTTQVVKDIRTLYIHPFRLLAQTGEDPIVLEKTNEIDVVLKNTGISLISEFDPAVLRLPYEGGAEAEQLANEYLANLRILPNLEKLLELQKQLRKILSVYVSKESSSDDTKKAYYLLQLIEDGLQRQALENYSDTINVYELIRTLELQGDVLAGLSMTHREKEG